MPLLRKRGLPMTEEEMAMSEARQMLLIIQGTIFQLDEPDQEKVKEAADD